MGVVVKAYWSCESEEDLREVCCLCKRPEASYKAVLVNEYGVSFVGYICSNCLDNVLNEENYRREELKVRALNKLVERVKSQKNRRKSYRIIELLPKYVVFRETCLANILAKIIEVLNDHGFEVLEGSGRNSGHYQVYVDKVRDEERLKSLAKLSTSKERL